MMTVASASPVPIPPRGAPARIEKVAAAVGSRGPRQKPRITTPGGRTLGAAPGRDEDKDGCAIASKVFVGNLSFDTTTEELQELFAQAGEIVNVSIPSDRMTGRPRGFAFVEYATDEMAAAAITKFEGYEMAGRRLRVNEATDRPAAGPGAGFSRPFGASGARPSRPKGSRRNIRGRKRSIW